MNASYAIHPFTSRTRSLFATIAAIAVWLPAVSHSAAPELELKKDDLWVMAGDSITAQRLHTNFIEAYYRTRFPKLNLRFRNSGIGGNRTGNVLARFDYDISAWKPAIVSVELGMNDVNNGDDPAAYIKGMRELIEKIRAIPAQPVLISSSPVDDGSKMDDWKSQRCQRLHPYTEALEKLAAEEKVVFVDQYHPLVNLWGENRRKGAEAAGKAGTPPPAPAPAPTVAADGQPAKPIALPLFPSLIPLGGNPVHPGPVGQYNMAAVILAGLHAPREVSTATISADGSVVEAKHCQISEAAARNGKITFTRLDEAGPWPILPSARDAVKLMPELLELSHYLLRVTGLPEGKYRISIDQKPAAVLTARELASGWNMSTAFDSAIGARSTSILALIGKLQGKLNTDWREASKAQSPEKLAAAQQAIDECETEVRAACQPVPLQFEIGKDTP